MSHSRLATRPLQHHTQSDQTPPLPAHLPQAQSHIADATNAATANNKTSLANANALPPHSAVHSTSSTCPCVPTSTATPAPPASTSCSNPLQPAPLATLHSVPATASQLPDARRPLAFRGQRASNRKRKAQAPVSHDRPKKKQLRIDSYFSSTE